LRSFPKGLVATFGQLAAAGALVASVWPLATSVDAEMGPGPALVTGLVLLQLLVQVIVEAVCAPAYFGGQIAAFRARGKDAALQALAATPSPAWSVHGRVGATVVLAGLLRASLVAIVGASFEASTLLFAIALVVASTGGALVTSLASRAALDATSATDALRRATQLAARAWPTLLVAHVITLVSAIALAIGTKFPLVVVLAIAARWLADLLLSWTYARAESAPPPVRARPSRKAHAIAVASLAVASFCAPHTAVAQTKDGTPVVGDSSATSEGGTGAAPDGKAVDLVKKPGEKVVDRDGKTLEERQTAVKKTTEVLKEKTENAALAKPDVQNLIQKAQRAELIAKETDPLKKAELAAKPLPLSKAELVQRSNQAEREYQQALTDAARARFLLNNRTEAEADAWVKEQAKGFVVGAAEGATVNTFKNIVNLPGNVVQSVKDAFNRPALTGPLDAAQKLVDKDLNARLDAQTRIFAGIDDPYEGGREKGNVVGEAAGGIAAGEGLGLAGRVAGRLATATGLTARAAEITARARALVSRAMGRAENAGAAKELTAGTPKAIEQPGQPTTYGVKKDLVNAKGETVEQADIKEGVLVDGKYKTNPSAAPLKDLVNKDNKILDPMTKKVANGKFMYVVKEDGTLVIGKRADQRMPHPTLVGGANPQVRAAGMVDIRGGRIYSVDNESGHFQPAPASLVEAKKAFDTLPARVFRSDSPGYLDHTGTVILSR
jgi:hypothetical protein